MVSDDGRDIDRGYGGGFVVVYDDDDHVEGNLKEAQARARTGARATKAGCC
jgi:hypothetical protein